MRYSPLRFAPLRSAIAFVLALTTLTTWVVPSYAMRTLQCQEAGLEERFANTLSNTTIPEWRETALRLPIYKEGHPDNRYRLSGFDPNSPDREIWVRLLNMEGTQATVVFEGSSASNPSVGILRQDQLKEILKRELDPVSFEHVWLQKGDHLNRRNPEAYLALQHPAVLRALTQKYVQPLTIGKDSVFLFDTRDPDSQNWRAFAEIAASAFISSGGTIGRIPVLAYWIWQSVRVVRESALTRWNRSPFSVTLFVGPSNSHVLHRGDAQIWIELENPRALDKKKAQLKISPRNDRDASPVIGVLKVIKPEGSFLLEDVDKVLDEPLMEESLSTQRLGKIEIKPLVSKEGILLVDITSEDPRQWTPVAYLRIESVKSGLPRIAYFMPPTTELQYRKSPPPSVADSAAGLEEKGIATLHGHNGPVIGVSFNHSMKPKDRKTLLTVSTDADGKGMVRVWDWQNRGAYQNGYLTHAQSLAVTHSQVGNAAFIIGASEAVRRDTSTAFLRPGNPDFFGDVGRINFDPPLVQSLDDLYPGSVAISPDRTELALAGKRAHQVRIVNLDEKQKEKFPPSQVKDQIKPQKGNALSVAFNPQNPRMVAMGSSSGQVEIWNRKSLGVTTLQSFSGHPTDVLSVAFSPDGKRLASADEYGFVQLYQQADSGEWIKKGGLSRDVVVPAKVYAMAFTPDGKTLAVAGESGPIYLKDVVHDQWLPPIGGNLETPIVSLDIRPDGKQIAAGRENGDVLLADLPAAAAGLEEQSQAARVLERIRERADAKEIDSVVVRIGGTQYRSLEVRSQWTEIEQRVKRAEEALGPITQNGKTEPGHLLTDVVGRTFYVIAFVSLTLPQGSGLEEWAPELREFDPETHGDMTDEETRLERDLTLIASETYIPRPILEALNHPSHQKYIEGYPEGEQHFRRYERFYEGGGIVDRFERNAQRRMLLAVAPIYEGRLANVFDEYAFNAQAHSGSNANFATYFAALEPGDKVMGLKLVHGGHLTHAQKFNFSGKFYKGIQFGVDINTGKIDYDDLERVALKEQPGLLIVGGTAVIRQINPVRLEQICGEVTAQKAAKGLPPMLLAIDAAHNFTQMLVGDYPSAIGHADFVPFTFHKSGGPRAGGILVRRRAYPLLNQHKGIKQDKDPKAWAGMTLADWVNKAIIPGTQGGPDAPEMAAKAVWAWWVLGHTGRGMPAFRTYAKSIGPNAKALAAALQAQDPRVKLFGGGTDVHLMLWNVRSMDPTGKFNGKFAAKAFQSVGLTTNANTVPGDSVFDPSAVRLGVNGGSYRGMRGPEMQIIAKALVDTAKAWDPQTERVREGERARIEAEVRRLTAKFPVYPKAAGLEEEPDEYDLDQVERVIQEHVRGLGDFAVQFSRTMRSSTGSPRSRSHVVDVEAKIVDRSTQIGVATVRVGRDYSYKGMRGIFAQLLDTGPNYFVSVRTAVDNAELNRTASVSGSANAVPYLERVLAQPSVTSVLAGPREEAVQQLRKLSFELVEGLRLHPELGWEIYEAPTKENGYSFRPRLDPAAAQSFLDANPRSIIMEHYGQPDLFLATTVGDESLRLLEAKIGQLQERVNQLPPAGLEEQKYPVDNRAKQIAWRSEYVANEVERRDGQGYSEAIKRTFPGEALEEHRLSVAKISHVWFGQDGVSGSLTPEQIQLIRWAKPIFQVIADRYAKGESLDADEILREVRKRVSDLDEFLRAGYIEPAEPALRQLIARAVQFALNSSLAPSASPAVPTPAAGLEELPELALSKRQRVFIQIGPAKVHLRPKFFHRRIPGTKTWSSSLFLQDENRVFVLIRERLLRDKRKMGAHVLQWELSNRLRTLESPPSARRSSLVQLSMNMGNTLYLLPAPFVRDILNRMARGEFPTVEEIRQGAMVITIVRRESDQRQSQVIFTVSPGQIDPSAPAQMQINGQPILPGMPPRPLLSGDVISFSSPPAVLPDHAGLEEDRYVEHIGNVDFGGLRRTLNRNGLRTVTLQDSPILNGDGSSQVREVSVDQFPSEWQENLSMRFNVDVLESPAGSRRAKVTVRRAGESFWEELEKQQGASGLEEVQGLGQRLLDLQATLPERQAAARGLGTIRTPESLAALWEAVSTGPNPELRVTIIQAIGNDGDPRSLALLKEIIEMDPDPEVAVEAADAVTTLNYTDPGQLQGARAALKAFRRTRANYAADFGLTGEQVWQYGERYAGWNDQLTKLEEYFQLQEAAGLEEVVFLSFDPAAGVALSENLLRTHFLVVAQTPTHANQLLELGVHSYSIVPLLWGEWSKEKYLSVHPGITHFVVADPAGTGWQKQVIQSIRDEIGSIRHLVVITDAESLLGGLKELGMPRAMITRALQARSDAEEILAQMK